MGEKIKKVFAVIGAIFTIVFCTVLLVLRRRDSDGQRSGRIDEYDTRITEGIDNCSNRVEQCSDRVEQCSDRVERCQERLHRAEEILREAIRRSREGKGSADQSGDSDVSV